MRWSLLLSVHYDEYFEFLSLMNRLFGSSFAYEWIPFLKLFVNLSSYPFAFSLGEDYHLCRAFFACACDLCVFFVSKVECILLAQFSQRELRRLITLYTSHNAMLVEERSWSLHTLSEQLYNHNCRRLAFLHLFHRLHTRSRHQRNECSLRNLRHTIIASPLSWVALWL